MRGPASDASVTRDRAVLEAERDPVAARGVTRDEDRAVAAVQPRQPRAPSRRPRRSRARRFRPSPRRLPSGLYAAAFGVERVGAHDAELAERRASPRAAPWRPGRSPPCRAPRGRAGARSSGSPRARLLATPARAARETAMLRCRSASRRWSIATSAIAATATTPTTSAAEREREPAAARPALALSRSRLAARNSRSASDGPGSPRSAHSLASASRAPRRSASVVAAHAVHSSAAAAQAPMDLEVVAIASTQSCSRGHSRSSAS